MWYAYRNDKPVGVANSIAKEQLSAANPHWEWLSEEEHQERQSMPSKKAVESAGILLGCSIITAIMVLVLVFTQ